MTEKNDFEAIMKEITMGLTGDTEADIKYLFEQMEKYKEHEYVKEISRACGRLMYEIIPEDKKEEFNKSIDKDNMGFNAAFEEIQFMIMAMMTMQYIFLKYLRRLLMMTR